MIIKEDAKSLRRWDVKFISESGIGENAAGLSSLPTLPSLIREGGAPIITSDFEDLHHYSHSEAIAEESHKIGKEDTSPAFVQLNTSPTTASSPVGRGKAPTLSSDFEDLYHDRHSEAIKLGDPSLTLRMTGAEESHKKFSIFNFPFSIQKAPHSQFIFPEKNLTTYRPNVLTSFFQRPAFTLAEVLITLTVIGVVAAITMPTVISKYNEQVTVRKVQKMYSTLAQAYTMNKATNDIPLEQTQSDGNDGALEVARVFLPYLKIAKDCGLTQKGCIFDGVYKYKNGDNHVSYQAEKAYRILLADGSSIWFRRTSGSYNSAIFYDTNGSNPPNMWGRDLFQFYIENDKVVPYYNEYSCLRENSNGLGCAGWLVYIGNMDYLHCDDLSLKGKNKCK